MERWGYAIIIGGVMGVLGVFGNVALLSFVGGTLFGIGITIDVYENERKHEGD